MICTYSNMTVKQWFETVGKEFALNCTEQISVMNDVLDLLWIDSYDIVSNEAITTFSSNGLQNLTTGFPIYAIQGWYAKASTCSANVSEDILFDLGKSCSGCIPNGYKGLAMVNVGAYNELGVCQFSYCRDGASIEANIPNVVKEGYVKYYRGFQRITSLNDYMPVQPSLNPAIKLLMKIYYAENSGASYQGDNTLYESRYEKIIAKIKEIEAPKMRYLHNMGDLSFNINT